MISVKRPPSVSGLNRAADIDVSLGCSLRRETEQLAIELVGEL
jgi:hypothetical protein